MEFDLIIKNANVVFEDNVSMCHIGVKNGKIASVFSGEDAYSGKNTIDAKGKYLLPGGIDTHSHFFEPGPTYREDFFHGTQAAAMGGYTTVMDIPNTDPPVDDEEHFKLKDEIFARNAHVDYMIWGAALTNKLHNIRRMKELGAPAFKTFTLDAGPTFPYS